LGVRDAREGFGARFEVMESPFVVPFVEAVDSTAGVVVRGCVSAIALLL